MELRSKFLEFLKRFIISVFRDFKVAAFDLEFLLDYVPFDLHHGCLVGCESKRGLRLLLTQLNKNQLTSTGIEYNLNELATMCHLPVVHKIDSNLLAIEITRIDVLTGQNMLPNLFILKIPFEKNGHILLKRDIQLFYENETNSLLLKDEKLYYFPVKKRFDKLIQVDLKTGDSFLKYLSAFPLPIDAANSRHINVSKFIDWLKVFVF